MNKVILVGRITKEPDIKYTQSGVAVVSFALAVDRGFKDANGEKGTDFINCVAWRTQAEFIGNWIKKVICLELLVKSNLGISKTNMVKHNMLLKLLLRM